MGYQIRGITDDDLYSFKCCFYKPGKQGMGLIGAGLEFGVELYPDHKRMIRNLYRFDESIVG